MACFLIPPFRVNYSAKDILSSLFVNEHGDYWRKLCRDNLSAQFDNRYTYLTSSGRQGLYIILTSLSQKKVFVPAYTCSVVIEAIKYARKEIVYVHTSSESFNTDCFENIDDNSIVLATHQYGLPCDIKTIATRCKETGAVLIEDCAAAFGTTVDNQLVGTFGDFAIFSFNSTKLITAPSMGGFILVRDKDKYDLIELNQRKVSCSYKYKIKHIIRGMVFCLSKNKCIYPFIYHIYVKKTIPHANESLIEAKKEIEDTYFHPFYEWQAKIVHKQLNHIRDIQVHSKETYKYYEDNIKNKRIVKPVYSPNSVCCRYTIRVKDREDFYNKCVKRGVDMDFSFSHIICPSEYKMEKEMASEILNLPFYYGLNPKDMKYIVGVLNTL